MEKYSCIIVEDEELPRLSLKTKLETYHPDIKILDMCDNCNDALESILRKKPQLLFLDIQLPGNDSMWLLEQLQQTGLKIPQIIFTTAFTDSKYLLKAIKFSAADYLNKPINITELTNAIEKVKNNIQQQKINELLPHKKTYLFRTLNSQLIVSNEKIVYIKADGNYSQLQLLEGKQELIFKRIGNIEKVVDDEIFIRAGRSLLINRNFIRKLNTKNGTCVLVTPIETYIISIPKGICEELKLKLIE